MSKIWLPNLVIKLLPMSTRIADGMVTQLSFKTTPRTTKVDIKQHLEKLYGLKVDHVNTVNIEGKKKRGLKGFYRRPDWKKAYVELKEPVPVPKTLKAFLDSTQPAPPAISA